ncbi:unnamed protein product [Didymodactylos carnosus]|uniref:Uncharacterized protein n=1 Tax=Didymodactylos carnosus TaxID=1234261 RepID=A0A814B564_9BILA|nr:unnamed protein product [Didymodactylos carnosus]CAF1043108.1 unnamed protein product [Didymodactylos carnosus]CAF3701210.1 unnamed protein product [Didymodactylos carnosus]CAF3811249.1 unnamed protein product [Didymodactylos carnosus]
MASNDQKLNMALDDIIKDNRRQNNNRGRGRGGRNQIQNQRRGGTQGNRRGTTGRGRITKSYNRGANRGRSNRGRSGYALNNTSRSSNYQQNSNAYRGSNNNQRLPRRGYRSNPSATYNPLRRDTISSPPKQQQSRFSNTLSSYNQGGNKNGAQDVGSLRRRMIAAQKALNRAQKTLASMPKIRLQRQNFLQQPQKLTNIMSRNRNGGAIMKRTSLRQKSAGVNAVSLCELVNTTEIQFLHKAYLF